MGRMYKQRRDDNDLGIFNTLKELGCDPRRGTEIDIYALHIDGTFRMLEIKNPHARPTVRPIQKWFRDHSAPGMYAICYSFDDCLKALGRA